MTAADTEVRQDEQVDVDLEVPCESRRCESGLPAAWRYRVSHVEDGSTCEVVKVCDPCRTRQERAIEEGRAVIRMLGGKPKEICHHMRSAAAVWTAL